MKTSKEIMLQVATHIEFWREDAEGYKWLAYAPLTDELKEILPEYIDVKKEESI